MLYEYPIVVGGYRREKEREKKPLNRLRIHTTRCTVHSVLKAVADTKRFWFR